MILHVFVSDVQLVSISPGKYDRARLTLRTKDDREYTLVSSSINILGVIRFNQTIHCPIASRHESTLLEFSLSFIEPNGAEGQYSSFAIGNATHVSNSTEHTATKSISYFNNQNNRVADMAVAFFYFQSSSNIISSPSYMRPSSAVNSGGYASKISTKKNQNRSSYSSSNNTNSYRKLAPEMMYLEPLEGKATEIGLIHAAKSSLSGVRLSHCVPLMPSSYKDVDPEQVRSVVINSDRYKIKPEIKTRKTHMKVGYMNSKWPDPRSYELEKLVYKIQLAGIEKLKRINDIKGSIRKKSVVYPRPAVKLSRPQRSPRNIDKDVAISVILMRKEKELKKLRSALEKAKLDIVTDGNYTRLKKNTLRSKVYSAPPVLESNNYLGDDFSNSPNASIAIDSSDKENKVLQSNRRINIENKEKTKSDSIEFGALKDACKTDKINRNGKSTSAAKPRSSTVPINTVESSQVSQLRMSMQEKLDEFLNSRKLSNKKVASVSFTSPSAISVKKQRGKSTSNTSKEKEERILGLKVDNSRRMKSPKVSIDNGSSRLKPSSAKKTKSYRGKNADDDNDYIKDIDLEANGDWLRRGRKPVQQALAATDKVLSELHRAAVERGELGSTPWGVDDLFLVPGTDRPADHTMLLRPHTVSGIDGSPSSYPAMVMRARGNISESVENDEIITTKPAKSISLKALEDQVDKTIGQRDRNVNRKAGRMEEEDLQRLEKRIHSSGSTRQTRGVYKGKVNSKIDKYSSKFIESSGESQSSDSNPEGNDAEVLQKLIEKVEGQLHIRKLNARQRKQSQAKDGDRESGWSTSDSDTSLGKEATLKMVSDYSIGVSRKNNNDGIKNDNRETINGDTILNSNDDSDKDATSDNGNNNISSDSLLDQLIKNGGSWQASSDGSDSDDSDN